jgi:hypothetical protein
MTRTDTSDRALTGSVGDLKVPHTLHDTFADREELATRPRPGFSVEAVQAPARVNVTCVTPLGEEVASTS